MTEAELQKLLLANPDLLVEGQPTVVEQRPRVKRQQPEEEMQRAIVKRLAELAILYPDYRYIFHVPNGGMRHPAVAAILKAMGVKAGVPDLLWLLPRGRYHGMAMELKAGRNTATNDQDSWLTWLATHHFFTCVVTDDVEEAIHLFECYYEGVCS